MNTFFKFLLCALLAATSVMLPTSLRADDKATVANEAKQKRLEDDLKKLDAEVERLAGQARIITVSFNGADYKFSFPYEVGIGFLIACGCALWAQNNRRNAWLWFFLGACFAPITLLVILVKNGKLRREEREAQCVSPSAPSIPPP